MNTSSPTSQRLINELQAHGTLSLGTWAFGGRHWGDQQLDEDSLAAMATAVAAGMTHFDTASGYGMGRSERLIGRFFREDAAAAQRVFLASKFFPKPGCDAQYAYDSVGRSLDRLARDRIDLYYLHWPRQDMDLREPLAGLERARAEGLIRYVGVSNFNVAHLKQGLEVSRIDAHQFCYNLIWRYPEEDILPFCRDHGIAGVSYSSIAQGVLTGKFGLRPQFSADDERAKTVIFEDAVWPLVHRAVAELSVLAAEAGRPLAQCAIRWVAAQAGITSVLVGARNAEQVRQNAAASQGTLAPEILARMTTVTDRLAAALPSDVSNLWRNDF